ncbi:MAG TPA: hypothetical protein VN668_18050 [Stellaceae bacterium]|nr:hypothetical protein [Stellaceae bacterium]
MLIDAGIGFGFDQRNDGFVVDIFPKGASDYLCQFVFTEDGALVEVRKPAEEQ